MWQMGLTLVKYMLNYLPGTASVPQTIITLNLNKDKLPEACP